MLHKQLKKTKRSHYEKLTVFFLCSSKCENYAIWTSLKFMPSGKISKKYTNTIFFKKITHSTANISFCGDTYGNIDDKSEEPL